MKFLHINYIANKRYLHKVLALSLTFLIIIFVIIATNVATQHFIAVVHIYTAYCELCKLRNGSKC